MGSACKIQIRFSLDSWLEVRVTPVGSAFADECKYGGYHRFSRNEEVATTMGAARSQTQLNGPASSSKDVISGTYQRPGEFVLGTTTLVLQRVEQHFDWDGRSWSPRSRESLFKVDTPKVLRT